VPRSRPSHFKWLTHAVAWPSRFIAVLMPGRARGDKGGICVLTLLTVKRDDPPRPARACPCTIGVVNALIAAARAEFARTLVPKAAALEALVGRGLWEEARRAAHKLRGSAGVYGFAGVGAAAAALDDILCSRAEETPDASEQALVGEKVRELRAEAEHAFRAAQ
jgi:HPt (histidine-containing phosphotransfer) domain-containing protein